MDYFSLSRPAAKPRTIDKDISAAFKIDGKLILSLGPNPKLEKANIPGARIKTLGTE